MANSVEFLHWENSICATNFMVIHLWLRYFNLEQCGEKICAAIQFLDTSYHA